MPRANTPLRAALAALAIAFVLAGLSPLLAAYPIEGAQRALLPPSHFIHLKAGTFDPLSEGTSWVASDWRLSSSNAWGDMYIVQFRGNVLAGQREALMATGATYHSYLPDDGFLVSATSAQLVIIRQLDFVRAIVPWEPWFRIDPAMKTQAWQKDDSLAPVTVEVLGAPEPFASYISTKGASISMVDGQLVKMLLPRSLLFAVASYPSVTWVEPWSARVLLNMNSAIIQGARQVPDGAYSPASLRLWSYNPSTDLYEGWTGKNVTVAVADTGLDTTHPAFTGKVVFYDTMGDTQNDDYGHGTHTAGTVLGNAAWRAADAGIAVPGKYAGIAPEADLVVQNIFGPTGSNAAAGIGNGRYGVSISSNSWASGSSYDGDARQYDMLTRDSWTDSPTQPLSQGPQEVLYFFSAGNAGGSRTIGSPAQGKNVVGVGATGDNTVLPPRTFVSSDQMAGFSSRGPADDGRIKPELVAPGVDVWSSMSATGQIYSPPGIQGTSYAAISGTSMSCPGAAGAAAVAWQYYEETRAMRPSPAMVKAILINGADEMANYPVLGPDQGFGRINLSTSLLNLSNRHHIWLDSPDNLSAGDEVVYSYGIADGTQPFAVSLVWTDEPGNTGATTTLVNNLDLWVVAPNGSIYRGNSMERSGDSFVNGVADTLNNAEKVKISSPAAGNYEVHIKGTAVPVGPQGFSLAVRGNILTDWYDIALDSISTNATGMAAAPIEGNDVTFNVSVLNRGTMWANGTSLLLEAETSLGNTTVANLQPGPIAPGTRFNLSLDWTTLRGWVTFKARVAPPLGQSELVALNDNGSVRFFVRGYGYSLATNASPAYGLNPGATLVLHFNVTQSGNVLDQIEIAQSAQQTTELSSYFFISPMRSNLRVNPGEQKSFTVTVVVPTSARAGDQLALTVSTWSFNDSRMVASFSTVITINHLYGFSFAMAPTFAALPPTGNAASTITLSNTGNGDDTLKLFPSGVPGGWTFLFNESSIALPSNGTASVSVSIQAPARANAGSLYLILVRASSDGAAPQVLNITISVTQVYGWSVSVEPPADEVMAGTVLEIPIASQNLGNGEDTIYIDLNTPPTWNFVLTRPRMQLTSYENLTSLARVTVNPAAVAGEYQIRLTFGGARNYTERMLVVAVKHVYMIAIDGPGYTIQMGQGEVATFDATVANAGNGPDTVRPYITPPEGITAVTIVPSATLERNASAHMTFQLIAARHLAPGLYNFTVDFRSGPNESLLNPLIVRVAIHEIVEPAPETPPQGEAGAGMLVNGLLAFALVVGVALPVGYLYLRRKQAKHAPPPQVIIQTVEESASQSAYDPTKGYAPGAPVAPARAPRTSAPGSRVGGALEFVGICNNCGGGLIAIGGGMGRCMSCGVEQIVRAPKR